MPVASLRALLARSIDYAGLFPPASLSLAPALRNQAQYVRSPERWMLGAFVLPTAKFADATPHFSLFTPEHPLEISALGPKASGRVGFATGLAGVVRAVEDLQTSAGDAVRLRQLEIALPADDALESLGEARSLLANTNAQTFLEVAAGDAPAVIAALAGSPLGFKLRTGGVTADAFPSGGQIARALVAAGRYRVPIKFTAGLHHPVRLFHSSVQTKMHGFLNVLGAGLLAAAHGWDEAQTEEMLADESAASFVFEDDSFRWRDWQIATAQIEAGRQLVTSLGSCSFDEPRDDLRALGLL